MIQTTLQRREPASRVPAPSRSSGRRHPRRLAAAVVVALIAIPVGATAASGAATTKVVVEPPKGAATPVAGSGIGTAAALESARCNTSEPDFGVYGSWNSAAAGGGPVCVKPWKQGADNGGETAQGVTADKITVVAVVPNSTQLAAQVDARTRTPVDRASGQLGTYADALNDQLQPYMEYYETWGRDIEVIVYESTGDDEAAQRADAVAITTKKPFAVLDTMTTGLDVLDTALAKAKIPVWGFSASASKATAQAPYRWGSNDAQAATIAAGEVIGKQLLDKVAEYGGDDVKTKKRVIGTVYLDGVIDITAFEDELAKYGGKVARAGSYEGDGSVRGDPATALTFAPSIVGQLKAAGVTTVALFADTAMNAALMEQANDQQWYPEWFFTGSFFADLAILTRGNPPEQMQHAFGLSNFFPYLTPGLVPGLNPLDWYWGPARGTTGPVTVPLTWLMTGVHTAGPNLTPKTFAQGLFSVPAGGGAITGNPVSFTTGFGKTVGLPYDQYMFTGFDFAPIWWDAETVGPSQTLGTQGKGVAWFIGGGKRYLAGQFPKQEFTFFSEKGAVLQFDEYPGTLPVAAPACTTCPSATGATEPGASSPTVVVGRAGGTGAQTQSS